METDRSWTWCSLAFNVHCSQAAEKQQGPYDTTIDSGIKVQVCAAGFAWDNTDWQWGRVTTGQSWSIQVFQYLQLNLWLLASTNMKMVHGSSCGTCSHDCVRLGWMSGIRWKDRSSLSLSSSYLLSLSRHMTAFTLFFENTLKSSKIPTSRWLPLFK